MSMWRRPSTPKPFETLDNFSNANSGIDKFMKLVHAMSIAIITQYPPPSRSMMMCLMMLLFKDVVVYALTSVECGDAVDEIHRTYAAVTSSLTKCRIKIRMGNRGYAVFLNHFPNDWLEIKCKWTQPNQTFRFALSSRC